MKIGRVTTERVGEASFEVSDAPVLEAEVGTGDLEPFVEGALVGGELADPLLECGVFGGDPSSSWTPST
ncbi:hypothetical protein [Streptomyces sp. NPDC045251]|uniref:hypothetical protein n=1 Tax=unclassified Streptomyces TaxID=2593676 RepID=UPI0033E0659E